MIQMNRENIMMIATAVCVVGLLFLFKELNKTREEMTGFKNFSENLVQQLNEPEQMEEEEQPLEKIEENVKE
jgi:choline kinase|tara:strand:+ start:989 stop:1204 length:216 start_codon:yes stop_codon:yes gene_type:complete